MSKPTTDELALQMGVTHSCLVELSRLLRKRGYADKADEATGAAGATEQCIPGSGKVLYRMSRGAQLPPADKLREEVKGQKGPNGRPLCTLCHKEVPVGRRSWCSQECVDKYLIDRDWGFLRRKVFKRDKGVCAICGADTERLQSDFRRFRNWLKRHDLRKWNFAQVASGPYYALLLKWCSKRGIPSGRMDSDWWDADHVVPVHEGGKNLLENIRTLCIPCHKAETDMLKRRIADARKQQPDFIGLDAQ